MDLKNRLLPDELQVEFLRELVSIESFSRNERNAVEYLCRRMTELGYDASVDAAGNAVGILELPNEQGAVEQTIVLLGHIDTVPGWIEPELRDGVLFGRGSVDAKGPLVTLVLAGAACQLAPGTRLIAVGAVEEETATSKGARQIAKDFTADYCVIGEPSSASAITLGYKGRVLIDYAVAVDEGHTAGPAPSAAELATAFWRRLVDLAEDTNRRRTTLFDQLLPSLRSINSQSDGLRGQCTMKIGIRLPPEFCFESFRDSVLEWAGPATLDLYGYEPAWQTGRANRLVRSLGRAIAAEGHRAAYKRKTGTADLNVVGPVWNCPIVAYGPGDSSLDHTPQEHVLVDEFLQAVRTLTRALDALVAEGDG